MAYTLEGMPLDVDDEEGSNDGDYKESLTYENFEEPMKEFLEQGEIEFIKKPPNNTTIRGQKKILEFINPLRDIPKNRLLNFTFIRAAVYQTLTGEVEPELVSLPNSITPETTYVIKPQITEEIMKKYIDDCYQDTTTDNEKGYTTSCSMNQDEKPIAIQITICASETLLSLAYDNQKVFYNIYEREFFSQNVLANNKLLDSQNFNYIVTELVTQIEKKI